MFKKFLPFVLVLILLFSMICPSNARNVCISYCGYLYYYFQLSE